MPIVLPEVVFTEPTTSFTSMTPEISAFLPGCPSLVIERTIRKIITDLCQRARVWSMDAMVVGLLPTQYEYVLAPKVDYADIIDVESAYLLLADGTKKPLKWMSRGSLARARPMWPDNENGEPLFYLTPVTGIIQFAPTPTADDVGDVYPRVYLRPTATASEWSTWLWNEYNREVFHGVLHELMAMPERSWSNAKLADYHGKQWTYLLSQATIRASKEYNRDDLSVQMRPFA